MTQGTIQGDELKKAADRLRGQIKNKSRRFMLVTPPTDTQIAMVLHALADHTAIMGALRYRSDPTSPWPEATSIGRWYHDVGFVMEDREL